MPYPTIFATPGVKAFAEAVDTERQAQLRKWGDQHHPDIDTRDIDVVTHHYAASKADIWKQVNAERATPSTSSRCLTCPGSANGPHTHTAWDGILLEEVWEALAESDPAKLRAELIQTAAVIAAWIADLDSRKTPTAHDCSHCGEPVTAYSRLTTTPGGNDKPDYIWHLDRGQCAEAAAAHHTLIHSLGYIVPPSSPDPAA